MVLWKIIGIKPNNKDELYFVGHVRSISEKTKPYAENLARHLCWRNDIVLLRIEKEEQTKSD